MASRGRGRPGGGPPSSAPFRRGPVGDANVLKPEANPECRLYVGNLDSRISEGGVLKLFRQFGPLKRCDYLWHTSGPKRGQPRGFCFIEFEQRKDAEQAKQHLSGKMISGRPLVVHFAEEKVHFKSDAPVEELAKTAITAPGAGGAQGIAPPSILLGSSNATIASALRNKLAQMEHEQD